MHVPSLYTLFTIVLAAAGAVQAAPVHSREIASFSCNLARAKLIGNLLKATLTVSNMKASAANDTEALTQIDSAADGLAQIQAAIEDVAINVEPKVIGLGAPPEDRDKVTNGLNQTMTALTALASGSNTALQSAVSSATTSVQGVASNSADVVADCK